jgi:hypothetical protein
LTDQRTEPLATWPQQGASRTRQSKTQNGDGTTVKAARKNRAIVKEAVYSTLDRQANGATRDMAATGHAMDSTVITRSYHNRRVVYTRRGRAATSFKELLQRQKQGKRCTNFFPDNKTTVRDRTITEIDGSSGTICDRKSQLYTDGVSEMNRNRGPGRRVATDAQGGTSYR